MSVRASLVAGLLKQCVSKGVKVVHVFAVGFADSGKEEGKKLQQELADIIKGSNTRVLGPNCMGVYCPVSGLTINVEYPREPGSVAIVSQTGSALQQIIAQANSRGIHFSKVVSYGNAVDIDSPDFLEYLTDDPETKCVMAYIEGVADGQRFLDAVAKCSRKKPVIILKAGFTEGGARAINTHTGTLVGTERVWRAFFKQTNAIAVETFDEALNQMVAFQFLSPPAGRRVGIMGLGGGIGIVATDICEKEGLQVPRFSEEILRGVAAIQMTDPGQVGRMIGNPLEFGLGGPGLFKGFSDGLKMIATDHEIDFLLIQYFPEGYVKEWAGGNQMEQAIDVLIDTVKDISKPVVVVIGLGHDIDSRGVALNAHKQCWKSGLPVFSTPMDAARAVFKLIGYNENRRSLLNIDPN